MIDIKKFTLENGLRIIVNPDKTTPLVAMNILYDVGSKDEEPEKTGFAHLFEHLMFGGSQNIPSYDEPLQLAGGENNAFTTTDITNYYLVVPKENIETGFWLESDRMLSLAFSEKNLEVQRNVVMEEFKQRYLNQPYGDVWLLLRPMVYKVHPYRWPTIGKKMEHIQNASLNDVKDFFFKFYAPNNAILSVSGNVEPDELLRLSKKWFLPIEHRPTPRRNLPEEPRQTEARSLTVERDVPFDAIYKAYHTCKRNDPDFYATDLISDILANGNSSRLYQSLIKEQKLFSEIDAYITADIDNGLFYIKGKIMKGVSIEKAETAIEQELEKITGDLVSDYELGKVKNRVESSQVLSQINALNKAMLLAYQELLGGAEKINEEIDHYRAVQKEDIRTVARKIFQLSNCSTLYYLSKK
ncbi:MAG: pitrilysin family protein [Bacteroidota bacterium]|nr:pitrilysin family protein [Bacteroidota bacterium]MDP4224937.1 pitrilysin family protein [Bacteroidota bacterium]MDP4274106.1 pitrilysin family protein [Bacteroidota bacterium]